MTPRMPDPIRILIADDHAVVRDGLAAMLEFQADMTVVGHAKNGREAMEQFRELKPDVAADGSGHAGTRRRAEPSSPYAANSRMHAYWC